MEKLYQLQIQQMQVQHMHQMRMRQIEHVQMGEQSTHQDSKIHTGLLNQSLVQEQGLHSLSPSLLGNPGLQPDDSHGLSGMLIQGSSLFGPQFGHYPVPGPFGFPISSQSIPILPNHSTSLLGKRKHEGPEEFPTADSFQFTDQVKTTNNTFYGETSSKNSEQIPSFPSLAEEQSPFLQKSNTPNNDCHFLHLSQEIQQQSDHIRSQFSSVQQHLYPLEHEQSEDPTTENESGPLLAVALPGETPKSPVFR
eukprot:TRINITY_DN9423_c0_g1_i1.p1 TRINITY_DN9423_c0_g1~~TRINITY_DN9423_c0_g1_i1.p1  ORF type:complete len:251 (-),score=45.60 TRINITY_DN9423_c0_g1_i1:161-913(-)